MALRQFADDEIDQLQGGQDIQLLAGKQAAERRGKCRPVSLRFTGWRWRSRLLLWLSHAMTLTCFACFANAEMQVCAKLCTADDHCARRRSDKSAGREGRAVIRFCPKWRAPLL